MGPKSAQRIAFYILNSDASDMARLTNAISKVKSSVSFCEICGNVSETKQCVICRDDRRDPGLICVVEESKDVVAIERTRSFTGRYHVLGGAINPLAGLGPEQLRIRELVSRLADERIQEIILAMDPNLEGEATATYLSRMLVPLGIRLSRLASGLPVGGDLEYADEITLGRALEGRRVISEGAGIAQANAAEDFEQVVDEEQAERERADAEPKAPRKRWSGSMFDDLDDFQGEPEDSSSDNPATRRTIILMRIVPPHLARRLPLMRRLSSRHSMILPRQTPQVLKTRQIPLKRPSPSPINRRLSPSRFRWRLRALTPTASTRTGRRITRRASAKSRRSPYARPPQRFHLCPVPNTLTRGANKPCSSVKWDVHRSVPLSHP